MKKIKELYLGDRPREKLLQKGAEALNTKELIAIILGSGSSKRDVLDIASEVSRIMEKDINNISIKKLSEIKGIGTAKACQLISSLELWNRLKKNDTSKIRITSAEDAFSTVKELSFKKQEHLILLTLDGANNLISKKTVFIGTLNTSLVHPREIFAEAISDRAAYIIIAHNHPSGNLEPSREDISTTERIKQAGEIIGITLLDHIIIAKDGYCSLKNTGFL